MPHRFTGATEIVLAILMPIVGAAATAIDVITSYSGGDTIFDKDLLRLYCWLGAAAGALLSILVFPPKHDPGFWTGFRVVAAKLLGSIIIGSMFTPMVFRITGWHADVDTIPEVSAVLSAFGVSALQKIGPPVGYAVAGIFVSWIPRWVSRKLGTPQPEEEITNP